MGVVNTNIAVHTSGASPKTISITLDKGIGNNRKVAVFALIQDSNPGAHSAVFDPTGVNVSMTAMTGSPYSAPSLVYLVYGFYLDDLDLPSAGNYDVQVSWSLVDNRIFLAAYYLEDQAQGALESITSTQALTSMSISNTISPSVGATVIDAVINSSTAVNATVDTPQVEVLNNANSQEFMSSYATAETTMGWSDSSTVRDWWSVAFSFAAAATGVTTLTVDNLAQSLTLGSVSLAQANVLSLQSILQSVLLESPVLNVGSVLSVAGMAHGHTLGALDLTQASQLTVLGLLQNHTLGNIDLQSGSSLLVDSLSQSQTLTAINLVQANVLAVNSLLQTHLLDQLDLTQAYVLSVAGLTQSHTLQSALLDVSLVLQVSDIAQAQLIESPALVQANVLAVLDIVHAQYLSNPSLVSSSTLIVSNAVHAHLLENMNLFVGVIVVPGERTIIIPAEDRVIIVAREDRVISIQ